MNIADKILAPFLKAPKGYFTDANDLKTHLQYKFGVFFEFDIKEENGKYKISVSCPVFENKQYELSTSASWEDCEQLIERIWADGNEIFNS